MFLCLKTKKEEEMKTIDIVNAYNVLNAAKLAKMQDADKFTVIRAMRALKPIQADYEAAVRDAQERLKPEDFDALQKKAADWNATHKDKKLTDLWNATHKDKKLTDLTPEERATLDGINAAYRDYTDKVEQCVRDLAETEKTLDYTRLSQDAFGKLLESNPEWKMQEILGVADVLGE